MTRAALLLLTGVCGLAAQDAAFEVASIKPTPADAQCGMIEPLPGGGLRVDCLSLHTILTWAYEVQDYQVTGGPPWASVTRWNILAKPATPDPVPAPTGARDLVRQRMRTLLTDRFQLLLRHETREGTAYILTVAKNGPKMKEAPAGYIRRHPGHIDSNGATMRALAQYLAVDLGRPVTDETSLTGTHAFTLEWTPDNSHDSGPSVFTAIEEQLGLRLESRKAPVETLVIERAEKPSDN